MVEMIVGVMVAAMIIILRRVRKTMALITINLPILGTKIIKIITIATGNVMVAKDMDILGKIVSMKQNQIRFIILRMLIVMLVHLVQNLWIYD